MKIVRDVDEKRGSGGDDDGGVSSPKSVHCCASIRFIENGIAETVVFGRRAPNRYISVPPSYSARLAPALAAFFSHRLHSERASRHYVYRFYMPIRSIVCYMAFLSLPLFYPSRSPSPVLLMGGGEKKKTKNTHIRCRVFTRDGILLGSGVRRKEKKHRT